MTMDNWEKSLFSWLDNTQKDLEEFYSSIDQQFNNTMINLEQEIDHWAGKLLDNFVREVDSFMEEVDILFGDLLDVLTEENNDEFISFFTDDVMEDESNIWLDEDYLPKPNPKIHPACVGCGNYHGYSYGGNLLVCGIHPYGWEGDNCPDWRKNET